MKTVKKVVFVKRLKNVTIVNFFIIKNILSDIEDATPSKTQRIIAKLRKIMNCTKGKY